MERDKYMFEKGRIENMDRSFDIKYWQGLGSQAIFDAAWQMVVDHFVFTTGKHASELRLQRSIGSLQPVRR